MIKFTDIINCKERTRAYRRSQSKRVYINRLKNHVDLQFYVYHYMHDPEFECRSITIEKDFNYVPYKQFSWKDAEKGGCYAHLKTTSNVCLKSCWECKGQRKYRRYRYNQKRLDQYIIDESLALATCDIEYVPQPKYCHKATNPHY